ncbi:MarC family protein [Leptolyngbya sp. FACHB-261]|nr:MarC family protein [Leptolyngbya sp. FACHB-261]MBD2100326.1 hypothetical protein [Leptolyngbya sp. FACHB-261]
MFKAGKTDLDIATRILGLLLAAVGVQFMLNGIAGATSHLINPAITGNG